MKNLVLPLLRHALTFIGGLIAAKGYLDESSESVTEATVSKWLKQVGDSVKADEPVVELETDKVSVSVPSPETGILSEIRIQAGTTVNVGAVKFFMFASTAIHLLTRARTYSVKVQELQHQHQTFTF